jgi:hypothetical protein
MIMTEGYSDSSSFGFTNTQIELHRRFEVLVGKAYGEVHINKNQITSRIYSQEISEDLGKMMDAKAFSPDVFSRILESKGLPSRILNIIADTEGSMIVSVRKAPNNYTVECRVVLASTNAKFTRQIAALLSTLDIHSRTNRDGVLITRKKDIKLFIGLVGFTKGVRVIRKKVGVSTWYGKEKHEISKVCLRLYREQEVAKLSKPQGCLASCKTRADVVHKLMNWYEEEAGGERAKW